MQPKYNFRPLDHELFETCVTIDYCKDCPKRIGCRIRYDFYPDDLSYEITLQLTEFYAVKKAHFPSDIASHAAQHIRKKREREIMMHPRFSYT